MSRRSRCALGALVLATGTGFGSAAASGQQMAATKPAAVVARDMISALARESRVQVQGSMLTAGSITVAFVLRYQRSGRESTSQSGAAVGDVQVGAAKVQQIQSISIGKTLYRSLDGRHWITSHRATPPTALDALSLNAVWAPCCVKDRDGVTVEISSRGYRQWKHTHVYALHYRRVALGQEVTGEVLVDARSLLPLHYTETSGAPTTQGSFDLTYGGSFEIRAPRP